MILARFNKQVIRPDFPAFGQVDRKFNNSPVYVGLRQTLVLKPFLTVFKTVILKYYSIYAGSNYFSHNQFFNFSPTFGSCWRFVIPRYLAVCLHVTNLLYR